MKLFGYSYDSDATLIQAYLILNHREIKVNEVYWIKGKGNPEATTTKFFEKLNIPITFLNGPEVTHIKDAQDFEAIESLIYTYYTQYLDEETIVFIGGGHKLYSLAMQKAANLFGVIDTFHMLFNGIREEEPNTIRKIEQAIQQSQLVYISLGKEPGWPAIKNLNLRSDENIYSTIEEISYNVAKRDIDHLNEFPFESLNLIPSKALEWLHGRLSDRDRLWINKLPKTELHCHLGGYGTHGEALEDIRSNASGILKDKLKIPYPEHWPLPPKKIDLKEYMKLGDNNGSYLLSDRGCLKRQVSQLFQHFISQNITYAEIRCSPYNYASEVMSAEEVLETIMTQLNHEMKQSHHDCHVNLIIIATRKPGEHLSTLKKHINLASKYSRRSITLGKCEVVAVDLAGWEHEKTRPSYYEIDFEPIHKNGVAVTIHAGENDISKSIWEAVFDLNTRRIGHGLRLLDDMKLLHSVVDRKIGVEMCPYANYQIVGFSPMTNEDKKYPLLEYLNEGIQVCVNTDNIGISNADITDNFMLLTKLCPGITKMQCLQLIRNGYEQAFIDQKLKSNLIKKANSEIFSLLMNYYNTNPSS